MATRAIARHLRRTENESLAETPENLGIVRRGLFGQHGDALAAAVPREILIDGHEHGLVDRPSVRLCLLAQASLVDSSSRRVMAIRQ